MGRVAAIVICFFLLLSSGQSFYLPGVSPRNFKNGDELPVKVNKLSSTKTQLPYDFYFLKYCKPKKIQNVGENLGEVLRGDRIENSVYTFHMGDEQSCTVACKVTLDAEAAKRFKEKIDDEYRVNMILDNLPVAVLRQRRDGSPSKTYEHGFRVGFKGIYAGSNEAKYFINNHLSFRVMYHNDPKNGSARIVGFEVTPGRSEVIKRRFTITKALLFKADRSSFDRLRQQIYKLELEQKRLEEDTHVYNWLQEQLKVSPAYKKSKALGRILGKRPAEDLV